LAGHGHGQDCPDWASATGSWPIIEIEP
jgi:hypothetical protein